MALILIWFSICFGFACAHHPPRKYYYFDKRVNFADAQSYCRENFIDVATITSTEDMSLLTRPSSNVGLVWIGLEDPGKSWKGVMGNDPNSWRWSLTGQTSKTSYCNWKSGQPDFTGAKETCVVINSGGFWSDISCNQKQISICFDINANGKIYELVSTPLTWTDAQANCRQYYKDLALIESDEDNKAVQSLNLTYNSWIGLYRVPWTWSDKSNSTFRNFAVGKPNNDQWMNYCVAELADHTWTDTPCTPNLAFFCYQDAKLKNMLRVKIRTDANMTDPAVTSQMLQRIWAALTNQGWNLFEVNWKIQPRN